MPVCSFDFKKVGPFNQTLFLGCSISDFNINLGWGADSSTCTIKLVEDRSKHPQDVSYAALDTELNNILSTTQASTLFDSPSLGGADSKPVLKNIAQNVMDKEGYRDLQDVIALDADIKDDGKIHWATSLLANGGSSARKKLTLEDPGFVGWPYLIIGCPAYFKFHDIAFGGYIKKWTYSNNGSYDIELSSLSSLLKGCQLILQKYGGSISTKLTTTGGVIAVPYGNTDITDFSGSIADGNIPNIFNIYGYLESTGFGESKVSERGIPASLVYSTLIKLLGDQNPRLQNPFSPYGAIVGKSVVKPGNSDSDAAIIDPNIEQFKGIPLSQLGLLKAPSAVDGINRSLFALDISEVPAPPPGVMLSQTEMSIMDFIDICCEGAGCNFIVDLLPSSRANFSGIIKIRVISRRIQPPPNILRNFFNTLTGNEDVLNASIGQEFSDEDVRSIMVGGPQERLYQVSSNTLSRFRSYHRFEPDSRSSIGYSADLSVNNLNAGNSRNTVREPLAHRQRWYDYAFIDGAAVAQETSSTIYFGSVALAHSAMNVTEGAYETTTPSLGSFPANDGSAGSSASYPLYADLISPYFGRDAYGNVRKVFFYKATSQLQISISMADISSFFPTYSLSGSFIVWENEIRAAMSAFDNWLTYIFQMSKLGFKLSTGQIIYSYIRNTYGTTIADKVFIDGLGILKDGGKQTAMPSTPPVGDVASPVLSIAYSEAILQVLQKLHSFFQDLGSRHYGKEYLVRLPAVSFYLDETGKRQYQYEIIDSGWEEEGNFLDDTIMIGSNVANSLAGEDGKFGVIIGYNNIAEYYSPTADNIANKLSNNSAIDNILGLARAIRPGSSSWYFPLVPTMSADEIYVLPYQTSSIPTLPTGPLVSRPTISITSTFPSAYPAAHGQSPANGDKYKIYVKGSTVDAASENKFNKKLLFTNDATYCVVSSSSPVWIRSPRSLVSTMMEDLIMFDEFGVDTPGSTSNLSMPSIRGAFTNINIAHNHAMLMWAQNNRALVDGTAFNGANTSSANMEINPRAAIPCFACIPVRLNNYTYGPWSSNPNLIRYVIFPNNETDSPIYTNNIVGGVKIQIDSELTPWNYGGIENLDFAVLSKIAEDNNYQQVLENGSLTVAGIQYGSAGVGYRLLDANMGPVINSIVTQIAEDGIKTTFSLRTYSRKLGFYNKEAAENIAKIGRESLRRRKEIADNIRTLSLNTARNATTSDFSDSRPKAMNWSPVNVLVGNAYHFVHQNSSINDAADELGFSPTWHLRPSIPPTVTSNPKNLVRQQTQVSIYDPGELPSVFKEMSYSNTSIMSMDGVLSPISFYPTPYGATYAISPYRRTKCPYCKNTGQLKYNYLDTSILTKTSTALSFDSLRTSRTLYTIDCRFCVPDEQKEQAYKNSIRPAESIPPFIVASGDDLTIINDSQNTFAGNNAIINRYTLNPMIMSASSSEFNCNTNKQQNDACGHSIDMVAFGHTMDQAEGGLRAALSSAIDSNYADNNVRFFGLRGPIMVHGWGYDTEGYPVPNSSGEFKIQNGNIVKDQNNNPVYKNQILQADGTYSKPYKENSFYRGWAQLPSTWPVGPVDLRWDDDAVVWTVGNNYKSVWVVLENDLVDTAPVRGTILEGYLGNDPLPNNLRKLVFVKDGSRLFSAPRGGAVYCKYNSDNGFYEPIYNQPFITSGTIIGPTLVTIYKAYNRSTITPDDATPDNYQTNFSNPLNLNANINSVGLFVYLNGSWVLQSTRT